VTAVLIDEFNEGEEITHIRASIIVERDSQKPIIIGAGGARIKQIGTEARIDLEKLLPPKVFLELHVKVEPDWRNSRGLVSALDYRGDA
jgi:GTP-binding protein Era